ncbi:MAG: methyltransferase domain-containing protein [Phycisphaeraceae bacterium]
MSRSTRLTVQQPDPEESAGLEAAVLSRYARGAEAVEPALCCPTDGYDAQYLKIIPQEILEKDYGCGDPSRHVGEGETVVDLGSGAGKICYILAQKVGANGRVIGLDFNDAMLDLARSYADEMAGKLGYQNFTFHKAKIQDMALDLDAAHQWLTANPVTGVEQLARFEAWCDQTRQERPLVPDDSVDAIVSNCVLNLVKPEQKRRLFGEMFRVLRTGGRAVISDIVCDEQPTEAMQNDPDLWSGCISGAFREDRFLAMFEEAGFHGVEILSRSEQPWQTINGIEFRAMTVRAHKGDAGPCMERNQAVVYKGPWKQVRDDDGNVYHRGERMAVCAKTYQMLNDPAGPYAEQVIGVEPGVPVPADAAETFDCSRPIHRSPQQTKRGQAEATDAVDDACAGGSCC